MSETRTRSAARLKLLLSSSLANLASPLSTLVTGPLLARALGPEGRGTAAALYAPLALAGLVFTLGVPDALTYFVASGKLAGKTARKAALLGGLIGAAAGLATLLFTAQYLFRGQSQSMQAFDLLLLSLPPTLIFAAVRGIAQGRQQFKIINQERILSAVLRLSVIAHLAAVHLLTPEISVWVTVLAGLTGCLFLLPALKDQSVFLNHLKFRTFTSYAASSALATFGGLMVIRLDQVLMVSLTSRAQLAYYAVAASLAELPLAVVSACRDFAFSIAVKQDEPIIIARFCRLTLLAVSIICIAGAVTTPFLLPLLFGKDFSPASAMAEILLIGTVCRAITAVMGAGLMTVGRTWIRSAIQLGGAALTALLVFALVPAGGGLGAALATSLTYAALAAASLFVYRQASGLTMKQCLLPTREDLRNLRSAAILISARTR